MKVKKSKFDSSHTCIFLTSSDEKYNDLKPSFEKHGLAFKHKNFIFFDVDELKKTGSYTKESVTFIEAHEIAHTLLKHTISSRIVEAEADFIAIILCREHGYEKSAKIGIQFFKKRNKIDFKTFSEKYKDSLIKRIKN